MVEAVRCGVREAEDEGDDNMCPGATSNHSDLLFFLFTIIVAGKSLELFLLGILIFLLAPPGGHAELCIWRLREANIRS